MSEKIEENFGIHESALFVKLKLGEEVIHELMLAKSDSLHELRMVIQEFHQLYFLVNFHFEYQGKKLNEYKELSEEVADVPDQSEIVLQIVQEDYDLRGSKDLIEKIVSFFKSPKSIAASLKYNQTSMITGLNFFNLVDTKSKKAKKSKAKWTLDKALTQELNQLTNISKDISIKPNIKKESNYVQLMEFSN